MLVVTIQLRPGIASDQAIKEVTPQLDDPATLALVRFRRQAEMLVDSSVIFAHELMSDDEIIKLLQDSPIGSIRGDAANKTHVLIYYDPQEGGETQSKPTIRTPPLRNKGGHLSRFIRLVMSRGGDSSADDLTEGDVYVINDVGKQGNKSTIINAFTNKKGEVVPTHSKILFVVVVAAAENLRRFCCVRPFVLSVTLKMWAHQ